ncbi:Protein kinase domain-containing protein [Mycena kentingensis (nom. inval.)]|nr:Protein kinase domain-containing protein [Mycena kentingensis (nom. inval.)]
MPALSAGEQKWKDLYAALVEKGFELRPRYAPNGDTEHTPPLPVPSNIIDATDLQAGETVLLRLLAREEVQILEALRLEDPEFIIPLRKIIPFDAEQTLLVMPFAARLTDNLSFETYHDLIRASLCMAKAISFIHTKNIAHRQVRASDWAGDKRIRLERGARAKVQPKCYLADLSSAQRDSTQEDLAADVRRLKTMIKLWKNTYSQADGLSQLDSSEITTADDVVSALENLLKQADVPVFLRDSGGKFLRGLVLRFVGGRL